MPHSIALMFVLSLAALFVFDVLLDRRVPGLEYATVSGLGAWEFLTRVVPIYMGGIGVVMLPLAPLYGAGLLALCAVLFLLGRHCRHASGRCS